MKVGSRLFIVGVLLVITLAMRINSELVAESASINLNEAVSGKLITVDVKGVGGHSGNCIKLSCKNLANKKISITVPAGTMFKPSDDESQNILIPQDQIFVLNPKENKSQLVRGFCCESHDQSPDAEMGFAISSNNDPKMKLLFSFLKGKEFDDNVLQDAVWCISNDHSVTDIYADDMAKVKALREEVCKITKQADSWYTTPKKHEVDEEGNISHETIRVTGLIKFKALKISKIHNEIFDANDKLIIKNPNEFALKPGNIEYEFDIKVGGWEKGTYYVKVFEGTNVIHKQEFKI